MCAEGAPTEFASAERDGTSDIGTQAAAIKCEPLIQKLFDTLNSIVLILNRHRQVVFANHVLIDSLNDSDMKQVLGRRPGEVFDCMHAARAPGGCGTSRFCRECGAVQAILNSQNRQVRDVQLCRILRDGDGDALNLKVCAVPLEVAGEPYTVFSIEDVSDAERRQSLERIFFHDVMNTALGVRGLGELLRIADPSEYPDFGERIYSGSSSLVDEIESQRELLAVENDDLKVTLVCLSVSDVLKNVDAVYKTHEVAREKQLVVHFPETDLYVQSDKALLERVVGNMVKNALEASQAGDQVALSCRAEENAVIFDVSNPGVMPEKVQLQLFQRSFSTKGAGRGLGTYSMKLISERYLSGTVSFVSTPDSGTVFSVRLPVADTEDHAVIESNTQAGVLGLRVLVADDNLVNAKVLERYLQKAGCEVAVVHNGRAAVSAVDMREYDVVLMDIEMPEMDGLEATRTILSRLPKEKTLRIIGLTAHRLKEDVARCLDAGMSGYIAKPINRDELLHILSQES